jgi:hypothetical protein
MRVGRQHESRTTACAGTREKGNRGSSEREICKKNRVLFESAELERIQYTHAAGDVTSNDDGQKEGEQDLCDRAQRFAMNNPGPSLDS